MGASGKPNIGSVNVLGDEYSLWQRRPLDWVSLSQEGTCTQTTRGVQRSETEVDKPNSGFVQSDLSVPSAVVKLRENLNFHSLHIVLLVYSIFSWLIDVGSDIYTMVHYYRQGEILYCILIGCFIILPVMLMSVLDISWRIHDREAAGRESVLDEGGVVGFVFSAVGFAQIVRYAMSLKHAVSFHRCRTNVEKPVVRGEDIHVIKESNEDKSQEQLFGPKCTAHYQAMLEQNRDGTFLKMVEAGFESAPQMVLQTYIIIHAYWQHAERKPWYILLSVLISLLCLAWAPVSQQRCIRVSRPDKKNLSWTATGAMFLWRLFTLSARCMSLVLFTLAYGYWAAVFSGLHVSLCYAVLVVKWRNVHLCGNESHVAFDLMYRIVYAVQCLFFPLHPIEGPTRWFYACFYALEFAENACLVCLAYFSAAFDLDAGIKSALCIFVPFSFFVGISFMLLHYTYLHPVSSELDIKCSKPQIRWRREFSVGL